VLPAESELLRLKRLLGQTKGKASKEGAEEDVGSRQAQAVSKGEARQEFRTDNFWLSMLRGEGVEGIINAAFASEHMVPLFHGSFWLSLSQPRSSVLTSCGILMDD
jgi:hypothetical protein